jgi:Tfp pilus assembly protein PilV
MKHPPRSVRGVSLVEAMVALAVMAFGMLTVVGVQSTLRLNGDIAKQRAEATRIAQESLEKSRAFAVIEAADKFDDDQLAWAEIVSGNETVAGDSNRNVVNTTYRVERAVATYADPPSKAVKVTVTWNDRSGQEQFVTLSSAIAGAAPAMSGTLHVRPGTAAAGPIRRPFKRHPTIPVQARDFGDGRSAFVPPFRSWLVLVFNNVTGLITGICDFGFENNNFTNENITPSDVSSCDNNTLAQLLSGFVRFWRDSSGPDLTAANAEDPPGPALRLRMQLTLTSSGHPFGSFCIDDANYDTTFSGLLPFATYFCVIKSNSNGQWSGSTIVEPQSTHFSNGDLLWQITDDTGSDRYRVCRYTTAASDTQTVPNTAHPRNYVAVSGNLTDQNFVVIPSVKHCPTDVAANPAAGDVVNSNTLQHQPVPSP